METVLLKDALTVIEERKSVRNYTGEKVSKEDVEKILHAAMAAPAAIHMLPWKFIVVTNKEKLKDPVNNYLILSNPKRIIFNNYKTYKKYN